MVACQALIYPRPVVSLGSGLHWVRLCLAEQDSRDEDVHLYNLYGYTVRYTTTIEDL